jgi:tripartite-type tricarboxylate transporter receptor subunit TctC
MVKFAIVVTQVLTASLLMVLAGSAAAQQDYPNRPVRIVVPYPPGGSNDFLARLFGPKLTEILGRQVIVDNRGGGNTIIGVDIVAKSAPDGYTLLLAGSAQVAVPHLYRNIPYDTINDFTPIAGIARSEFLLVVHPSLPVKTVRDLIALAKNRPGELNYATSSTGGPTHLGAVQFQMLTGAKMQQVPYKGGGPAMLDLVAGHVQLGFANPAGSVPFVKSGRLRAIAVTGEKRLETLPQIPTFAESGLPGLALRNWYAITAPAGTSRAVIDKLAAAILKITAMPEIKAAITRQGLETFQATAEQVDAIRREDMVIVAKLIKAADIKMQP